jgi:hypothetical protein
MPVDQKMMALLDPDNDEHKAYVRLVDDIEINYAKRSQETWSKVMDYWDLYLAEQDDPRDSIDENWRSKIFVPLPSSNTIAKTSELVNILTSADPMWQVSASTDDPQKLQAARPIERLLDYSVRMNSIRRLMFKLFTSRAVQGTAFMKLTFRNQTHDIMHYPQDGDIEKFQAAIQQAVQAGAVPPPSPMQQREEFEEWRKLTNTAGTFGRIPDLPEGGVKTITTYTGPVMEQIPMWDIRLDPTIEDMCNQKFVMHRYIRTKGEIMSRADNDMSSGKPYYLPAVKKAIDMSSGEMVLQWEKQLTQTLGVDPPDVSDPVWEEYGEILEVWSPDEKYKFAVILNRQAVINKNPFEFPTTDGRPNIFGIRNLPIQGHYFGLSDFKQPEELFKELNQFRRLRMDGATLTVMPAFIKQAGLTLPQNMRAIRPGGFITLPNLNGIKPLFDHQLPSEAYKEPAEIKTEIDDATGISGYTKGKEATINRVTGTEVQGRAGQTQMRFKVDTGIIEDDLSTLPNSILSMWHQLGEDTVRIAISGSDPLVEVSKSDIAQYLNTDFHFNGPTRAQDPDMLVQQLVQATAQFQDVLDPSERRAAYKLILDTLDIRGTSKLITPQGEARFAQQQQAEQGAATAEAGAAQTQAEAANSPSPNQPPPQEG